MGTFGDKSRTVFAIALENFVRNLSRQCQLDRVLACTAQQVGLIAEGDGDISPFAGAEGPLVTDANEPNQTVASLEAVGHRCR